MTSTSPPDPATGPLAARVLAILHRDTARTDTDLARMLAVSVPDLSAVIGRLYRRRLVDRCAGYLTASPALARNSGTSGTSGTCAGQQASTGFRPTREVPEPPEPAPPEGATMTTPASPHPPGNGLLESALRCAARGWPVFPLRPGSKRPAFPDHDAAHCTGTDPRCHGGHTGWEQRATTDPARITRAWTHTRYNIGIATGPAGLVVIDLDTPEPGGKPPPQWALPGVRDGSDVLAVLAERHCHRHAGRDLFDTFMVRTVRGGLHLYYTPQPSQPSLRNTCGTSARGLGWLIDTRAHGGYVVAPGSLARLPDGGTGRYEVVHARAPARLPDWLAALLTTPPAAAATGCRPAGPGQVRDLDTYTTTALSAECERVRGAVEGGRNHALNKAAFHLGQLIAAGVLPEDLAAAELAAAASVHYGVGDPPFTEDYARSVIGAGIAAGKRKPRPLATVRAAA
ncbi:MAG TPA: bifunctional DNA primase/polymerase [Streptosporangiaceae bacterium]|jgi:hypothetical protein